jgi:hypothetical protein
MNHRLGIQPSKNLQLLVLVTRYLADAMFFEGGKFGILLIEGTLVAE